MKKKFAGTLAALLAALCLLPAGTLAAEPEETAEPEEVLTFPASYIEGAVPYAEEDNGHRFAVYAAARLYGGAAATAAPVGLQDTAGSRLTGNDQAFYAALAEKVRKTAQYGGSASFTFTAEELGFETSWTLSGLGYTAADAQAAVKAVMDPENGKYAVNFGLVVNALLADFPYELYWFDKTLNYSLSSGGGSASIQDGSLVLADVTFTANFPVAQAYQKNGRLYTVRTDVAAVGAAADIAREIVAENAGKSDGEKLAAYKDAICGLTSYNHTAASAAAYGDPWQLIWVFDGSPDTTVVCEGYSKAFQYLCDLSEFDGAACYTVSGYMEGGTYAGPHMWNLVRTGGESYLVDVTNSDDGMIGADGGLFLAGAEAYSGGEDSTEGHRVVLPSGSTVVYYFDEEMETLWGSEILALSAEDYQPQPLEADGP